MNLWDYLNNNPNIALVGIVILCAVAAVVIFAVVIFFIRFNVVWKWYQEAKTEADFNSLSKSLKRDLKKKKHSIIFASSVRDNDWAYKKILEHFDEDGVIRRIDQTNVDKFDEVFGNYDIVVFQVASDDANKSNPRNENYDENYQPLYKSLANYCKQQKIQCVLLTFEYIDIASLDPIYVTTVNFYAKLRETLYILLYFSPKID